MQNITLGLTFNLIVCLFIAQPLTADSPMVFKKENKDVIRHYLIHTVTETAIVYPAVFSGVLGLAVCLGLLNQADTNPALILPALAALITGVGTGTYMCYKAPQWTDTYCLGYEGQRTTRQNIISLLSKLGLLLLWPVNIWVGEYLADGMNTDTVLD